MHLLPSIYTSSTYIYALPSPGSANPAPTTSSTPVNTPTPTTTGGGGSSSSAPAPTTTPDAGNPFTGYQVNYSDVRFKRTVTEFFFLKIYLSPFYASEVQAAAAQITDSTLKAKAASVANIPTFTWFDVIAKTSQLGTYLADASAKAKASGQKYLVQIVVYDLPDRDCAALASNGEFSIADNGLNNYKTYIDQLVAQIKREFLVHFHLQIIQVQTPFFFKNTLMFVSSLLLNLILLPTSSPT